MILNDCIIERASLILEFFKPLKCLEEFLIAVVTARHLIFAITLQ
jgi:hypothetical protein